MVEGKRFNIYGTKQFETAWKKFKEICTRENTSASKEIRNFVKGVVSAHSHGNSQTLISSWGPKPLMSCWVCHSRWPELPMVLFIDGKRHPTCSRCITDWSHLPPKGKGKNIVSVT